jgi:hypothetical protein
LEFEGEETNPGGSRDRDETPEASFPSLQSWESETSGKKGSSGVVEWDEGVIEAGVKERGNVGPWSEERRQPQESPALGTVVASGEKGHESA